MRRGVENGRLRILAVRLGKVNGSHNHMILVRLYGDICNYESALDYNKTKRVSTK